VNIPRKDVSVANVVKEGYVSAPRKGVVENVVWKKITVSVVNHAIERNVFAILRDVKIVIILLTNVIAMRRLYLVLNLVLKSEINILNQIYY